mgnify:CR=1 FL=1
MRWNESNTNVPAKDKPSKERSLPTPGNYKPSDLEKSKDRPFTRGK